ncbi:hypothetical protein Tco_1567103 [Tanacetum coccineum]
MDDPNITIEEYIRLEEENTHRHGKYNWETATYGKIWYDEDVHDLRSVEIEFPAIVFKETLTSEVALSCEPTVSPVNDNQIDFRISFDESDDEDCTVIYDKNSFSYKIISIDDLKIDSKNNNYKVNLPSFPSFEPTVSYFDDFDYFKDFENEFPAIAYNDALTSKLDFSKPTATKSILRPSQPTAKEVRPRPSQPQDNISSHRLKQRAAWLGSADFSKSTFNACFDANSLGNEQDYSRTLLPAFYNHFAQVLCLVTKDISSINRTLGHWFSSSNHHSLL